MTVQDDKVTANDLSKVVWLNAKESLKDNSILTKNDLEYQENRRKRKVRCPLRNMIALCVIS